MAPKWAAAVLLLMALHVRAAQRTDVAGIILTSDGRPVPSARIGAIDRATGTMTESRSDTSGRFRLSSLQPGHSYRLVFTRFGYNTVTVDHVIPGGRDLEVTLPVSRADLTSGQPGTGQATPAAGRTYKVSVGLVTLNVTVRDSAGAPVRGLKKQDFRILEDGAPQEIAQFAEENSPASVVMLMDTSSSMEGAQIAQAKRAAREFVDRSGAGDEIALVAFTQNVDVQQPPTLDRSSLRGAIDKLSAHGGTALYDAIVRAIEILQSARYPRRIILVFSDGIDADSRTKFSGVQQRVEASDVVIYAVGEYLGSERARFMTGSQYYKLPALEENYNPVWVLRELAEVSGGSAFFPEPGAALEPFFARIAQEVRDQYLLAYVPPPPSAKPEFRHVEVRVASPGAPYSVRTRKGYLSPGTEQLSRNK